MNKKRLMQIRIIAICLSTVVASLTLCNLFTVATHAVSFEIPEPNDVKITIDPVNKDLVLLSNFAVNNNGAYDINDIDINAKLLNEENIELMSLSKKDLVVPRGSNKIFDLIVSLDVDKIPLLDWFSLIYEDTSFKLLIDIDASYMYNLIDLTVDEVVEIPWKSPLTNFTENKTVTQGLETIFNITAGQKDFSSEEYNTLISFLKIANYTNSYKDIYEIDIQIKNLKEGFKELIAQIKINIPMLENEIKINFKAEICTLLNQLSSNIKEVNISLLD